MTTHILAQEDAIYLEVDTVGVKPESVQELLVEAKQLATERGVPVLFPIYSYGNLFYVTSESNLDDLMASYMSKNHTSMLIK